MIHFSQLLILSILIVTCMVNVCGEFTEISCGRSATESDECIAEENKSCLVSNDGGPDLLRFLKDSLKVYAPVSDAFDNDLCRNHSLWFEEGVLNNKLWAWRMFDASSRLPIGSFVGNVIQLGNYDQCLGVEDVDSEFGQFSGQHCMVALGERSPATELDLFAKKELGLLVREITDDDLKESEPQHFLPKMSMLWSVCVPSSCRAHDVEQHLRRVLHRRLGGVAINVSDVACNTKATKTNFSTNDWFAMYFLAVIGILVVSSTWYDSATSKTKSGKKILLAFSLRLHVCRLLKVNTHSADNLPEVNGIKVMNMIWVLVLHHAAFLALTPAINHSYLHQFVKWLGLFSPLILNASLAVDSFFLVGGLLVCFNFLKDRDRGIPFNLPRYYLHRYIRLTPMYAVIQLLILTLYTVEGINEGPFWRPNSRICKANCANWFYSMFYVNNYLPKDTMCMGHTWYLSVDMQLFWLSPLILYPLWRWPTIGRSLVGGLTILGAIIQSAVAYSNKLHVILIGDCGDMGSKLYYPTHTRFTPWVIGIGVGYALHVTKGTSSRLSRATVTVGWILGLTLMLAALLPIYYFLQPDYQYDRLSSSLYIGLMRPGWALGLAWIVFALIRGYGGLLGRLFSNQWFQVLSRLSYAFYFVHLFVMISFLAFVKTPQHIDVVSIVSQFLVTAVCSLCVAIIFHLLFEAPPVYIENVLLRQKRLQKRT